jgi:predicted acylesterase/phospholipase RssA
MRLTDSDIYLEKIARATSAAPTYFEAVKIGNRKLGDGGFGCNNPSWEAYNEIQDMHNSDDKAIALLVSIGTGESFVRRFSKAGGYAELFQALRAAKGLATDTHRTDELLRKITRKRKDSYFRFNADERLGKIKLDCWKAAKGSKPSTADEIREVTEDYLNKPSVVEEIDVVAQILVANRRMRSKADKWEERLFGIKWRCVHEGCSEGQQLRRQVELQEHLQTYHNFGPVAEQSPEMRAEYEDLVSRGRCELHNRR